MIRTFITYGTSDLLYIGHVDLIKFPEKTNDYFIVELSTDYSNTLNIS
ncbi:hypothetical protein MKY30_02430 [Oceanobacillus sp. FSL W8-0428]|uniref:Uncharacterized protein n=1 Tax=Oceanobacillus sojae TaxID=582851 RepID=A0A511ZHM1_9BACI|nr:hypothetical protein [Oceanobacillus sojae]GEN86934.1 hypothetical protein OSO01_16730 [Oceanobacillus sojae]